MCFFGDRYCSQDSCIDALLSFGRISAYITESAQPCGFSCFLDQPLAKFLITWFESERLTLFVTITLSELLLPVYTLDTSALVALHCQEAVGLSRKAIQMSTLLKYSLVLSIMALQSTQTCAASSSCRLAADLYKGSFNVLRIYNGNLSRSFQLPTSEHCWRLFVLLIGCSVVHIFVCLAAFAVHFWGWVFSSTLRCCLRSCHMYAIYLCAARLL